MRIPKSKEAALAALNTIQSKVVVYSDGSGQNGQIGAAAVLYRHGVEQRSLRKQLGSKEQHTVFKVGVLSLLLAVELIGRECQVQTVIIRVDSQAAFLVARQTRAVPGQYLLGSLHEQFKAI